MFAEIRLAWRQLAHAPGFAAVAVTSIALGLAANIALFSFVADVFLRPLPLTEPEKLALVWEKLPNGDLARPSASTFEKWSGQVRAFEQLGAMWPAGWALTGGEGPAERARGGGVTPGFCDVFRYHAQRGRLFGPDDFQVGHENVAVISDRFWRRRFNADPAALGQTITLNQVPHTVIGVLTPSSTFAPDSHDVLVPLVPETFPAAQRNARTYFVLGRLRQPNSHAAAQAEMDVLARRIGAAFPDTHGGHTASVRTIYEWIGFQNDDRKSVLILFAAVGCVQLIVCANLGALLLARAIARRKEVAVRAALGASAAQLARQFLVEALLLAALGGGLGLLLALALMRALVPLMPALPMGQTVHVTFDGSIAAFAVGATLLTGFFFGLLPAWQAARVDLNEVLKDGSRGATGNAASRRWGGLLVTGEIALAVALVVGAGLIGQTWWRLGKVPLGFAWERTGFLATTVPVEKYPTDEAIAGFAGRIEERAGAIGGVTHAAVASRLPLRGYPDEAFSIVGAAAVLPASRPRATTFLVGADYLAALDIPLVRGRTFTRQDRLSAPRVALVNQLFAEKYFPGAGPIGQQLLIELPATGRAASDAPTPWQIVGVIGNVRVRGVPGEDAPMIMLPFAQHPVAEFSTIVRTAGATEDALRTLRRSVNELDRDVLADRIDTFANFVAGNRSAARNQGWLLGGFASVALLLAGLGVYGVIAYGVGQRTREIGIRMALGAQALDVLRLVLQQGLAFIGAGVVAGLGLSFALGRMMRSLLYGVPPFDPLTAAAAVLVLAAIALFACWLPARRAVRIDPTIALRAE